MPDLLILLIDLVAINVLVFGVYYRRHYRRDMLLAFIGLNVGVLAVSAVLSGVTVGVGVGLGLFGVLSIVRLRSSEISQQEVAYFFASLASSTSFERSSNGLQLGRRMFRMAAGRSARTSSGWLFAYVSDWLIAARNFFTRSGFFAIQSERAQ